MSSPEEIRSLLERAFDFRGDVTLSLVSGEKIEGYVFDRKTDGIRLFPKDRSEKITVKYCEIVGIDFTGPDMATGRSYELWLQKHGDKSGKT